MMTASILRSTFLLSASLLLPFQSLVSQDLSLYVGRYQMQDESVLLVNVQDGLLTARPIFWRSTQFLLPAGKDTFVVDDRPERQLVFVRSTHGRTVSARFSGIGDTSLFQRLGEQPAPIELLFEGKPQEAFQEMNAAHRISATTLLKIGRTLLRSFPSRASDAVTFLRSIVDSYPDEPGVYSALADACIAAGMRDSALVYYERALNVDATDDRAITGVRLLKSLAARTSCPDGWTLPVPLDSVFAKPNPAEIRAVETDWATRDLSASDASVVATYRLNLGHVMAEAKIVAYSVHGYRTYGAVIVPDAIVHTPRPIVLELRGVAWNYPPLNINTDLIAPRFLDADQGKFIYVVPSFRGEVIEIDGMRFTSEGDRTDALDGATDDALALLSVAARMTPEADPSRICAFGKSRGGTVALLAGIRDKRITGVLNWVGPVDWFDLMATGGWTQWEIVADGLCMKAAPDQTGGQFIERFLKGAVEGKSDLSDVRRRMLASSPLYFAQRLPLVEAHYGTDDDMVPVKNGEALRLRLGGRGSAFSMFFHTNAGHDLNRQTAFRESNAFVVELLKAGE